MAVTNPNPKRTFPWGSALLAVVAFGLAVTLDKVTGTHASPLMFYIGAIVVVAVHSGWRIAAICAIPVIVFWRVLNPMQASTAEVIWNGLSRLVILCITAVVAEWVSDQYVERIARHP